jgi:hypothetical protein
VLLKPLTFTRQLCKSSEHDDHRKLADAVHNRRQRDLSHAAEGVYE